LLEQKDRNGRDVPMGRELGEVQNEAGDLPVMVNCRGGMWVGCHDYLKSANVMVSRGLVLGFDHMP
jgi:hypothetical protein